MKIKNVLILLVFLICTEAALSDDHQDDVLIKSDLKVDYKQGDQTFLLEAFPVITNDHNRINQHYGELEWYSFGYPFITVPRRKPNLDQTLSNQFEMTKTGFNVYMNIC